MLQSNPLTDIMSSLSRRTLLGAAAGAMFAAAGGPAEAEDTHGDAFGHISVGVKDAYDACRRLQAAGVKVIRQPGPMKADPEEVIAFIEDPDGHRIELVEQH